MGQKYKELLYEKSIQAAAYNGARTDFGIAGAKVANNKDPEK